MDYPACRAQAWLNALEDAAKQIELSYRHFSRMRLNPHLAGLASAALLYPVTVATPEMAEGLEIKVFLKEARKDGSKNASAISAIISNPAEMLLEMCILAEIQETLLQFGQAWPKSIADSMDKRPALEKLGRRLDGLWFARVVDSLDKNSLAKALTLSPESAVINFLAARESLAANNPQNALKYASAAIDLASQKAENTSLDNAIWNFLLAQATIIRALAHWRLGQFALAENDFTKGIDLLVEIPAERSRALLYRADLRRERQNMAGMCADYASACAAGDCSGLSSARRNGFCQAQTPLSGEMERSAILN